jgi:RNA polymerase sigma factor (sigma-70 family)
MDPRLDDGALVAAARRGEVAALGLLLERHRAGMRAVAISVLGWSSDAEDAVQDAMLVALRRLGDVRDPAAVGPWLRAVTRNECRARLRRRDREGWIGDPDELPGIDVGPEESIDRNALRGWVWSALESLPTSFQVVVLLRYFTEIRSYAQIAAVCEVPVGTVRSRLHQARRRLTERLLNESHDSHSDSAALTARRQYDAEELLASAPRGDFRATLAALAVPGLQLVGPQGQRGTGHELLVQIMESDLNAGVCQRLVNVTAGQHVIILECDLLNPTWDPEHCPPSVLWLAQVSVAGIERIRLFHPERQSA